LGEVLLPQVLSSGVAGEDRPVSAQHIAVYGNTKLGRARCEDCKRYALIVGGELQCCGQPFEVRTRAYRIMVESEARRRRPSAMVQRSILEAQRGLCFYCDRPFGSTETIGLRVYRFNPCWDHLVPYSYSRDNHGTNFVAACATCNAFKSNKIFDTVDDARSYVRRRWGRLYAKHTGERPALYDELPEAPPPPEVVTPAEPPPPAREKPARPQRPPRAVARAARPKRRGLEATARRVGPMTWQADCAVCGVRWTFGSATGRYCSLRCMELNAIIRGAPGARLTCPRCHGRFVPTNLRVVFCSTRCRSSYREKRRATRERRPPRTKPNPLQNELFENQVNPVDPPPPGLYP
jgi:hypothetical protein